MGAIHPSCLSSAPQGSGSEALEPFSRHGAYPSESLTRLPPFAGSPASPPFPFGRRAAPRPRGCRVSVRSAREALRVCGGLVVSRRGEEAAQDHAEADLQRELVRVDPGRQEGNRGESERRGARGTLALPNCLRGISRSAEARLLTPAHLVLTLALLAHTPLAVSAAPLRVLERWRICASSSTTSASSCPRTGWPPLRSSSPSSSSARPRRPPPTPGACLPPLELSLFSAT